MKKAKNDSKKPFTYSNVAPFRFFKKGDRYFLSNDVGAYVYLDKDQYEAYLAGDLDEKSLAYKELC